MKITGAVLAFLFLVPFFLVVTFQVIQQLFWYAFAAACLVLAYRAFKLLQSRM